MARSSGRGDLFITVGGDVTPLTNAMKAGKSVLNQFGTAAIDVQAEVQKAFADMAANPQAEAKKLERAFSQTFDAIRKNAQSVLSSGNGAGAVELINAAGARQAADAAALEANALRQTADAAARADAAAGGTNAAIRVLAASTETAALEAEQHAAGMRTQAEALSLVDGQLERTAGAQRRLTQTSGSARAGMQQLGYQLNDVAVQFAAGTPPSIIFSQQISQVTQAVQLMSGGTSKVASFLGGPWGIAISVAVTALAPFVGKLFESGDATEKAVQALEEHERKVQADAQAQEAFGRTAAGASAELRQLTTDLAAQNRTLEDNVRITSAKIENDLRLVRIGRAEKGKELDQLRGELAQAKRTLSNAQSGVGVDPTNPTANIVGAAARVQELEERITATQQAAERFDRAINAGSTALRQVNIPLLDRDVEDSLTREGRAAAALRDELAKLRREKIAGTITDAEYTAQSRAARLKKADEVKSIREDAKLERSERSAQLSGRLAPVTLNEVRGLISGAFDIYAPNSHQLTEGKHAKNSFHYRGQAIDFVPKAGVHSISKEQISAVLEAQGVDIKEIYGPGDKGHSDHFHVAFAKQRLGSDRIAAREAADSRASAKAVDHTADQNERFAAKRDEVEQQLLAAKVQLVTGISAQAGAARDQLTNEKASFDAGIAKQVREGQLRDLQGAELIAANAAVVLQKQANVTAQEKRALAEQTLREQDEAAAQAVQFKLADLQDRADHADTLREQRAVQLEILDIMYREKKRHLETEKAQADLAGETAKAARIQAEIENLPKQQARDERNVQDSTRGPLGDYRDRLQRSVGDMNTALGEVKVHALQGLEDGLLGVITGTESVSQAFKRMAASIIADLARIAIEKLILKVIGGGSGGFADGGLVSAQGHAAGGLISGPGTGTSDSILSWLSDGEFVVREKMVRKHGHLLKAINEDRLPRFADGGAVGGAAIPSRVLNSLTLPDLPRLAPRDDRRMRLDVHAKVDASPLLLAKVEETSIRTVAGAADPIMEGAEARTMRRLQRAELPGGGYG